MGIVEEIRCIYSSRIIAHGNGGASCHGIHGGLNRRCEAILAGKLPDDTNPNRRMEDGQPSHAQA